MGDTVNSCFTEDETRIQDHQDSCPSTIHHNKWQRWGLHPNFISKALTAVTSVLIEADMAETCSLPEQQLVPLASGLRKGVDERMHCVTEKNLGGEWLWGARKRVGCQGPGQECWHTAFLLFASLKCTVLLHVQMPPTPRTPTQDGHLAHSELFLPPWAVRQCPSHPLVSALLSTSRATSPSLKPFPYTMEWLTGFLPTPK